MTETKANKVLKSLKASPELHREIKRESADTGESIEVLVEKAWRAFKSGASPTPLTTTATPASTPFDGPRKGDTIEQQIIAAVEYLARVEGELKKALAAVARVGTLYRAHTISARTKPPKTDQDRQDDAAGNAVESALEGIKTPARTPRRRAS